MAQERPKRDVRPPPSKDLPGEGEPPVKRRLKPAAASPAAASPSPPPAPATTRRWTKPTTQIFLEEILKTDPNPTTQAGHHGFIKMVPRMKALLKDDTITVKVLYEKWHQVRSQYVKTLALKNQTSHGAVHKYLWHDLVAAITKSSPAVNAAGLFDSAGGHLDADQEDDIRPVYDEEGDDAGDDAEDNAAGSQYIAVNEDEEEKEKLSEDVKEQSKEESESSSVKSPHVQRGGKRRRDTAADKVIAASTASIDRLTAVAERLVEGMVKSNPSTQSAGSSQVSGVMLPPPMPADCTPREYYRALAAFYSALEANSGPDPAVPKV